MRIIIAVFLFLVLLTPTSPALAGSTETDLIKLDLNGDSRTDYAFTIDSSRPCTVTKSDMTSTKYEFMRSDVYSYELLDTAGSSCQVGLTLNYFPSGDCRYILNVSPAAGKFKVKVTACDIRGNINYLVTDQDSKSYINKKSTINTFSADNVLYVESANRCMRLGKVFSTTEKDYSIKIVHPHDYSFYGTKKNSAVSFNYEFMKMEDGETIRLEGILSNKRLVDWSDDLTSRTIKFLDFPFASESKYGIVFLDDGMYWQTPTTYLPHIGDNSIYKYPSGLIIRSCYRVLDHGSIFADYGLNLTYDFSNSFNEAGYIPTQPQSKWLYDLYGFGHDFYDTRYNSDTVNAIFYLQKAYYDEDVMTKISKYIAFYKDHYKKYSFSVGNATYVSDYSDPEHKNIKSHCSLNHMVSEIIVLYEYYDLTGDKESLKLANVMLSSISMTYKKWIKEDGDLWYSVDPKGKFSGNDYPLVTYNDLTELTDYLRLTKKPIPKEIQELRISKKAWAKKKGYI